MQKKSTIEKNLLKYSAVAGTVLAGAASADAQVVYYDVNPDYDLSNGTIGLDIDQDGTFDFAVVDTNLNSGAVWLAIAAPLTSSNGIAGSAPAGYNYPFKLNNGDVIDAAQTWLTSTGTLTLVVSGSTPYSSFWGDGVVDGYMGLRFVTGGNTYYGWVRMDIPAAGDHVIFKDFAFNTTANGAINAGDMGNVSVNEEIASKVSVANINNMLQVTANGVESTGNLSIISMNGQVAMTHTVNGSTSFDISTLASGIYTVSIVYPTGTFTKKIFVK
ncbi:MAG: T9SS type A sorting domain-containing protein [Flavobacteriales bacterium]|nr:T9SS type A sorting domain-containing protein [Flavobacteriales bacterium]